jgi:hypothetical protein
MNLADVVKAALSDDDLIVRSWILDLHRNPTLVSALPRPDHLDASQMAVAAGLVEQISNLLGTPMPSWVSAVAPSPHEIFLPPALAKLPRSRAHAVQQSPAPFKKRRIFASADYLSVA